MDINVGSSKRFRVRYFDAGGNDITDAIVAQGGGASTVTGTAQPTAQDPDNFGGTVQCTGPGAAQVVVTAPNQPAAVGDLNQVAVPVVAASATVEFTDV